MNNFSKGSTWYLSGTRVVIAKAPMASDHTVKVKYLEDRWSEGGTIVRKKGETVIVYMSSLSTSITDEV